jgi:Uma2 family endonuclease
MRTVAGVAPRRWSAEEFQRMVELEIIPRGPVELIDGEVVVDGNPWRVSSREYHRLGEAGILAPTERVELIHGEIVVMSPIGSPHAGHVRRLTALFGRALGDEAVLSVQNPLALADGLEPEPDFTLLAPREDFYTERHPGASDVLLLVEVADSSLSYDEGEKAELYAASGVIEYWLVDLVRLAVHVHTFPSPVGYRSVVTRRRDDRWTPGLLPGLEVAGGDLLG